MKRWIKFLYVHVENMPDFGYAELFPEKSRNSHPEIKSFVPVEKVVPLSAEDFVHQMGYHENPTTILLV